MELTKENAAEYFQLCTNLDRGEAVKGEHNMYAFQREALSNENADGSRLRAYLRNMEEKTRRFGKTQGTTNCV